MKKIRLFLSEIFQFLEVKFSLYLNRRVFVMKIEHTKYIKYKCKMILLKDRKGSELEFKVPKHTV